MEQVAAEIPKEEAAEAGSATLGVAGLGSGAHPEEAKACDGSPPASAAKTTVEAEQR